MDIVTANMTADRFWDLLSRKISSEANEAELKELEAILFNNPDLKSTAEALSIFENQVIPFNHDGEAERAFEKHIAKIAESDTEYRKLYSSYSTELEFPKKARRIRRWALAVTLMIMAGISVFLYNNNIVSNDNRTQRPITQSVSTKPGSRTYIQLPDGSTVWLNASSKLTYGENFGKKLREVNLTGEAFFDVAKDPAHPFIIHTNVIDVKVLGTAFNVKSYPNDANTETSVLRGKVEVTVKNRENTKYYLSPKEKVIVANQVNHEDLVRTKEKETTPILAIQPLTYYHVDSSIIETSWVENKLVFQENETFRDVALKMERWYGVHIRFVDPSVADYRMYGSFTTETIKQALDALKIGFNFNYKINKDEIIISK